MPKTAGSSFQATLEAHFGEGLKLRYEDRPLHRSAWSRNFDASLNCLRNTGAAFKDRDKLSVHGHFLPLNYRLAKPQTQLQFVTWLRDPVQRLLSHYHYWKRSYQPGQSGPLHQQMIEEDWSLEQFAVCRELRNLYSIFLWGFPLERFDFIGITEHYPSELEDFGRRVLNAPVVQEERNRNPNGDDQEYKVDGSLLRLIETAHAKDIALYSRALMMRELRLEEG